MSEVHELGFYIILAPDKIEQIFDALQNFGYFFIIFGCLFIELLITIRERVKMNI
ncbi:MAG: hypothetical protein ACFFG0_05885 [Candidatus Thorarchaeota archaeon]